jgi:hypothetical protein
LGCRNAASCDLLAMKQRRLDHFCDPDGLVACDITGNPVPCSEARLKACRPKGEPISGKGMCKNKSLKDRGAL